MRIAIIGAGLAGLVAGYRLSGQHEVVLFEQEQEPGGLLSSYRTESYTIERYYHHFFGSDTALPALLSDLGLSDAVVWLAGSTGSFIQSKIHPLTSPVEILLYPYLGFLDKVKLGLFTKKAAKMDMTGLDEITAREFIHRELGEAIYRSFFEPLLVSKFGKNADKVSAAWLLSRVAIRSDRSIAGERLGYLKGGFSVLIDRLVQVSAQQGCTILTRNPVARLEHLEKGWKVNGEFFDAVISTVAPAKLASLGVSGIPEVPYQGAACMILALPRDVANGIYWINMNDPAPFGAVISHTNFAPFSWYGEHLVYVASYFTGEPDPAINDRLIDSFCQSFAVHKEEIIWSRISVDKYAGPLYLTGYRQYLKEPDIPDLYCAGMFSPENYPERSIEGSIRAAERVISRILT
ncbi:MAG TPA: NAD(P)/FAD-dependent oxidoreductase [Methanospirillum sp.]|nr:NAD(P)/FAD-dependent oxidoreductase [Methanospirillum sp.]